MIKVSYIKGVVQAYFSVISAVLNFSLTAEIAEEAQSSHCSYLLLGWKSFITCFK
jgi:hypothetical protein